MKKNILIASMVWLCVVGASFFWNIAHERQDQESLELQTAQSLFRQIVLTRTWNAQHGGVYVPVSEEVRPNPYLRTPARDITTTEGLQLTMINPAFMTRQVAELADKATGVKFHITSLKPIRPENKANEWETAWLQSFEKGAVEQHQQVSDGSDHSFRYMAPLYVEKACLQCHGKQGYKLGDIRGGISVNLPLASENIAWVHVINHGLAFIIGLLGICFAGFQLNRGRQKLIESNEVLRASEQRLSHAQATAHVGDWEWDIATNAVHWSDELYRIYGFNPGEVAPDYALILSRMHPDSKDAFMQAIDAALTGERPFEMVYTFFRQDGSVAVLHAIGDVTRDQSGAPVRMVGVVRDITDQNRAEEQLKVSENKFHTIFCKANDGILIADTANNVFIDANDTICEMLGYARDEFCRKGFADIHPVNELPAVMAVVERQLRGELSLATSIPVKRKDGTVFHADINASAVDIDGKQCLIGIFRNISERKRAEDTLQRQKDFLQNALDALTHPFYIIDAKDYTIKLANKAAKFGELHDGVTCYQLTHHRDVPCEDEHHPCLLAQVKKTKQPVVVEHRHHDRHNRKGIYEVHAYPIFDDSGNVVQMIEYALDITEQKKKEKEIAFLASIVTNLPDAVCSIDMDGNFFAWNKGAEIMFGYSAEEMIGRHISVTIPEELVEQELDHCINTLNRKGFFTGYESVRLTRDKRIVPVEITALALRDENQQITSYTSMIRDISRHKRAEEELQRWSQVFEHAEWGVAVSGGDSKIMEIMNPAFARMHGYTVEELVGKPIFDVFAPESRKEFLQQIQLTRKKGHYAFESNHVRKDGTVFPVLIDVTAVKNKDGMVRFKVVNVQDLTLRKQLEAQLRQSQKLEAVGTLAGGIAHDFNNILAAMIGFTELARYDMPAENAVAKALDEVLHAGMRAKDLVSQILAFSRQAEKKLKPFKVQYILKEALHLLRASIPTTIEFKENIDKDCGPILADPTQIHQVIMNLGANAYHAMRESTGTLAISLSQIEVASEGLLKDVALQSGKYVLLEISDTGCGIEPAILDRIFEPYFTTKKKEEGTGLGLSVVHGIVKSFDGHISITSEPGKGTTMQVYLPLLLAAGVDADLQKIVEETPLTQGTERILAVDDEKNILRFEQQVLSRAGYVVTALDSSVEALQLFQAQPENFDLIITDMTMPKMTGAELARNILAVRPDIPIILCTGYSSLISEKEAKAIGIREFYVKPLDMHQLTQGVRKVLDDDHAIDVSSIA